MKEKMNEDLSWQSKAKMKHLRTERDRLNREILEIDQTETLQKVLEDLEFANYKRNQVLEKMIDYGEESAEIAKKKRMWTWLKLRYLREIEDKVDECSELLRKWDRKIASLEENFRWNQNRVAELKTERGRIVHELEDLTVTLFP